MSEGKRACRDHGSARRRVSRIRIEAEERLMSLLKGFESQPQADLSRLSRRISGVLHRFPEYRPGKRTADQVF